jgi:hypothetical protein
MKKGKRGQIFIIAAIIIIIILVGLAGVSNRVYYREPPAKFYDLSNNLQLEGYNLYDYGKYNQKDAKEIINNFTGVFSDYVGSTGENTEFMIIQGNINNVSWTIYESPGGVQTSTGGTPIEIETGGLIPTRGSVRPQGSTVTIPFNDIEYTFNLSSQDTFIFVFTKSEGFNSWVQSNYGGRNN